MNLAPNACINVSDVTVLARRVVYWYGTKPRCNRGHKKTCTKTDLVYILHDKAVLVSSLDDSNGLQLDDLLTDTSFMTWTPNKHIHTHACLPFLGLPLHCTAVFNLLTCVNNISDILV